MMDHRWNADPVPSCMRCGVTSLEAQYWQPETKGIGPCPGPFPHIPELNSKLLRIWANEFNRKIRK